MHNHENITIDEMHDAVALEFWHYEQVRSRLCNTNKTLPTSIIHRMKK